MNYTIKRSNRKTIGLQITDEGLIVRAPYNASDADIREVVSRHSRWIDSHLARHQQAKAAALAKGLLSAADIRRLADEARDYIPGRVHHYAALLGVVPGRITIRHQKTRWGSCSARGNMNFNCLLMLAPPDVIDSVIVHELCHLLELNHSQRFYGHVLRVFPEYQRCHAWLRQHGPEIMARANPT